MEGILALLIPIIAITLSLCIPIVGIIYKTKEKAAREKSDREVRRLLIENKTDYETSQLLIRRLADEQPKNDKNAISYGMLRAGCMFVFMGLSLIPCAYFGINGLHLYVTMGAFMGLGMLVAFVVEYCIKRKQQREKAEKELADVDDDLQQLAQR